MNQADIEIAYDDNEKDLKAKAWIIDHLSAIDR